MGDGSEGFDPIAVLERVYDLDASLEDWLTGLASSVHPSWNRGMGTQAVLYRRMPVGVEPVATGLYDSPEAMAPALLRLQALPSPELDRRVWSRPTRLSTFMELATPTERGIFVDGRFSFPGHEVRDISLGLLREHDEWLLVVGAFSPQVEKPTDTARATWQRLATHVQAITRLRWQLASGAERVEEAVLAPSGRVLHAEGRAKSPTARERLRESVARIDRARGALRKRDPARALELWSALVAGRWTLLDRFDSDGKRLVVALRNDRPSSTLALSGRQLQVAELAALALSNKEIGYALGLETGTVASYLALALRKLGLSRREDLVALAAAPPADEVMVGDATLAVTRLTATLPQSLTEAERATVEGALRGLSNAAIGEARGVSVRTVANQLQQIYRKLGVRTRAELTAKVLGQPEDAR